MPDTSQNWVPAGEAQKLVREAIGDLQSRTTICRRAHSGLIHARAQKFFVGGEDKGSVDIPKGFWWAEGEAALKQNWSAGDFETWINSGSVHLRAFGVSFSRDDIETLCGAATKGTAGTRQPSNDLDDSELRGRVLASVFGLRHQNGGRVPITDTIFSGLPPVDRHVMSAVCDHLQKANLIEWQPVFGSGSVGHAQITGFGIDVYLGKARSPIDINLPGRPGGYGAGGYGMGPYGGPQPGPGPVPTPPPIRVREGVLVSAGQASMRAVAIALRENREAVQLSGTALAIMIEDKLATLRAQRLNSPEAHSQIEKYEDLKSKIEALCEAASTTLATPAEEETAFQATLSFVDTLKNWWQQRHMVAFDAGLFLVSISVCQLAAASDLTVAICGAVVGGRSVAEVIKAVMGNAGK